MKNRRRNRLTATPAHAPASRPPARAAGAAPGSAQIRNAYSARWLAAQALQEIEAKRSRAAAETLVAWTAGVAGKGRVDLSAAVKAAGSWKCRDGQMAAQRDALASLSKLLEDQIGQFRKSDPANVIAVLKERIARLQAGQDRSEHEGSARQAELKTLLDELSSLDPDQPGHAREGRKSGSRQG